MVSYLTDGERKRAQRRLNGVITNRYVHNEQGQLVGEFRGGQLSHFVYASQAHSPDFMMRSGETYRLIKDQLGSIRLVVNVDTGTVAQRLDYDEFGVVLNDTAPGFQPFGFAGGVYDSQTGLVRFGARDYDPFIGRWTAKDPIRFKGRQANLYLYATGDPVNHLDTNGKQTLSCLAFSYVFNVVNRRDLATERAELIAQNLEIAAELSMYESSSDGRCQKIGDSRERYLKSALQNNQNRINDIDEELKTTAAEATLKECSPPWQPDET